MSQSRDPHSWLPRWSSTCRNDGAAPGRVQQLVEAGAPHGRPPRGGAAHQHPDDRAGAERVAAEVVVGEPEVRDEREGVVGQHVGRVGGRVVRLGAVAVAAHVGHDHAVPALDQTGRVAAAQPGDRAGREESVQQQHRAPLADLAVRQLRSRRVR